MDPAESENPKPTEPERTRPRWQFSLWWMFVLMTVLAVVTALVHRIGNEAAAFAMLTYVAVMGTYLFVRLPMLLPNPAELQRIQNNRRELLRWAEQRRKDHRGEEMSRDG